uniref:Uncharacterized protein n=1 Tax=Oryza barthii TaxID=65489 RepID=A0A0D3GS67_9ORYZ
MCLCLGGTMAASPADARAAGGAAAARGGVVQPRRGERAAGGAAVGAVLRQVRRRRPGLLRHRGAGQPQLRRAPRRGGPVPGGALRVAPRQGHRRRRPGLRRHPLRHRLRPQAALQVALRGATRLQALRLRRHGRRRRRQVEGQARCSWPEVHGRGIIRSRKPPGPEVKRGVKTRKCNEGEIQTRRQRQLAEPVFPLCKNPVVRLLLMLQTTTATACRGFGCIYLREMWVLLQPVFFSLYLFCLLSLSSSLSSPCTCVILSLSVMCYKQEKNKEKVG